MFKNRFRELRTLHKQTQSEIAELVDVAWQTVGAWERGMRLPTAENLLRLSKIYNVSIDYLLDNSTDPDPALGRSQLTSAEDYLLKLYGTMNNKSKEQLLIFLSGILGDDLADDEQKLLNLYSSMNDDGKEQLLILSETLAKTEKYRKSAPQTREAGAA